MIATATLTDSVGRRPLTVYPYAVTVVSVLCLGIIGCFDYTAKATSSLLVSLISTGPFPSWLISVPADFLRLPCYVFHDWCFGHRLRLRGRDSATASQSPDSWLVTGCVELYRYHIQLLYPIDDQRIGQVGSQDWFLVSTFYKPSCCIGGHLLNSV